MTCIVGLIDNDTTYIGVDSLGSDGWTKTIRKDKKVFKLKDNPNAIIGYTTSFRMGQLLMYANNLIETDKQNNPNIDHEYLVTKFIPNVIELFQKGKFSKNDKGEVEGGFFLLGYKSKLYKIESDFQVSESTDNYDATGCGESFALGSLKTTENMNLSSIKRIHLALQAATKFSVAVAPPYYIMNTKDDEVIKFDE